jgi:MoaA/NifB/PqqE/SkfB family radical SAM enzyme
MNHRIEELPILILYPHSRCNCRCVMCDIWKTAAVEEISAEELERHAAGIEKLRVRWVVFSGGEPLMHSDLFRLCATLRGRGVRTTILSTGLLLERHAEEIVKHVDDVIVSLDGPPATHDAIRRIHGAFERLRCGVEALRGRRPEFPVMARCTVQRLNCGKLRETIDAAKQIGLDSISFLAADVTSTAFNRPQGWSPGRVAGVAPSRDESILLEDEIDALIRTPDPFVIETSEKLRRIALHFRAQLGLAQAAAPRCNAPWVSAVVEADGNVRPCFFHPSIGNWRGGALEDVINGPAALAFREGLDVAQDPVCRRCVCSLYLEPATPRSAGALAEAEA